MHVVLSCVVYSRFGILSFKTVRRAVRRASPRGAVHATPPLVSVLSEGDWALSSVLPCLTRD